METLLEWVVSSTGFDICEGVLGFNQELKGKFIPFLRRREKMKERF